jgi:hypothetical protein
MTAEGESLTDILAVIMAGFEHSGTTMASELLRQHPVLDNGFEGGMLLKASPREFIGFVFAPSSGPP